MEQYQLLLFWVDNCFQSKRYIAVFNLHKNLIMLVFPTGIKADDPSGLLEGNYKDVRKLLTFKSLGDAKLKHKA
jgi:hypothetical protein